MLDRLCKITPSAQLTVQSILRSRNKNNKWSKNFDDRLHHGGGIFHRKKLTWQSTASATSQSECWSTACGEIQMVLGGVWKILVSSHSKVPLPLEDLDPIYYIVPWDHVSPHPKWLSRLVQPFLHGSVVTDRLTNKQTDQPIDHVTQSVTIGCIYYVLVRSTVMLPNNNL